ncbi:MAG TPA: zinc ribbon domain-containing protein [Trebonia sp.]
MLREETERVSARRSNLNDALAWSAARWTVDQAIAAGATAVFLEDLRTLEARGMGKTMNTRISQSVRGKIVDRVRHLAAKEGIAVVTVPPRGTSKHCPRCLAILRHSKAPDRPGPGWKWASCPSCGWQGDRDQGAWMRIAARGLTHQQKTAVDRETGTMRVRAVDEALEDRAVITPYTSPGDRSKTGPTPRRKMRTSRPAPRRREIPSPARPSGPAGQRPEGRARTDRTLLPRAAARDHDANTISTQPVTRPHRARGAALGAGFHLGAHATPPRQAPRPSQPRIRDD